MPVKNPISVPTSVLAVENDLLVLKNDTRKSTNAEFAGVISRMTPTTLTSETTSISEPPFATMYSSANTSATRLMMMPTINELMI